MHECDICYTSFIDINVLRCCKGKRMCITCKNKYNKKICPFCRRDRYRSTIIIINKNKPCPEQGNILMTLVKKRQIIHI